VTHQSLRELLPRVPPAQRQGKRNDDDDHGLMTLKQRLQQHTRLLLFETARPQQEQVPLYFRI